MPSMADIEVYKTDGTTLITWTKVVPSAGDKSPAVWKSQSVGSSLVHRPEMKMVSLDNANGTQRITKANVVYPVTQTGSDGIVKVIGYHTFVGEFKVFAASPDTVVNEFADQTCQLVADSLFRSAIKSGYSPS